VSAIAATPRQGAFARYQRDMALFSRDVVNMPLYRYQTAWCNRILAAAANHTTETIVVKMSRQSGKNEGSAQTEAAILARLARRGGEIVKAAPTFKPQIVTSKRRFEQRAQAVQQRLPWIRFRGTQGYIVQCGAAAITFLSASPDSNIVGATANLLLEIDEAQDVDPAKYEKDLSPMRASTGAPVAFYGTSWTDDTLLAQMEQAVSEGRTPGAVYLAPWDRVAEENPAYGAYVQSQIARLGAHHPIILTQYALREIPGSGRAFSPQQLRQMVGGHARQPWRRHERAIVAGLDFAGADEGAGELISLMDHGPRDSVALTIGAVDWVSVADGIAEPVVRVLDRYEWINQRADILHTAIYRILTDTWRVDRIHCDATGIGAASTAFLARALGDDRVAAVTFDGALTTHTRLASNMIAAANGSRFIDYAPTDAAGQPFDPLDTARQQEADPEDISRRIWWQRGHARLEARANKRFRMHVPAAEGHDDLLTADLLALDAAHALGTPSDADAILEAFAWAT